MEALSGVVTREQWPGLAGDSTEEPSELGQSCHQPSSLRDKAKCGGSRATYTFHFVLSSCPKKRKKRGKKREGWSGEKEREAKELLIFS